MWTKDNIVQYLEGSDAEEDAQREARAPAVHHAEAAPGPPATRPRRARRARRSWR